MDMEGLVTASMRRQWIEDWAYAPMPYYPGEDWDILIAGPEVAADLFDIIERGLTPKDRAFLKMLYLTVGDVARSGSLRGRRIISTLIERGLASPDSRLARWASRSRDLFDAGGTVDYNLWCGGGFSRQERASLEDEERPLIVEQDPRKRQYSRDSPLRQRFPGRHAWFVRLDTVADFLDCCRTSGCAPLALDVTRIDGRNLFPRPDLLTFVSLPVSRDWGHFVTHACRELQAAVQPLLTNLSEDAARFEYRVMPTTTFEFKLTVFAAPDVEVV